MDEDLKRRLTSEVFEQGLGHSGQPTARVKLINGKRLREWQHKDMASHLRAQSRTLRVLHWRPRMLPRCRSTGEASGGD